jgi:hypothetical protein
MKTSETKNTEVSSTFWGFCAAFLGVIFGVIVWLVSSFVAWDFSVSNVTIRLILVFSVVCGVLAKFLTWLDELAKPK